MGGFARRARRRVPLLLAVVLAHGVLLVVLIYSTQRYSARAWALHRPDAAPTTTQRLVVQLLPLAASGEQASTAQPVRHAARHPPALPAPNNPSPSVNPTVAPNTAAAEAQPSAGIAVPAMASAPVLTASNPVPAVQPVLGVDEQALRRALADTDKRGVRGLFKESGRLDVLEPVRQDRLAVAMAGAGTASLGDMTRARIARDNACKQELGKSGVGDRSYGNDRDTFMSSYIGAGRECKK